MLYRSTRRRARELAPSLWLVREPGRGYWYAAENVQGGHVEITREQARRRLKKYKPVRCDGCGQEWPRDPALEVTCPTCGAGVGHRCKRPSEHAAAKIHAGRDRLALATVEGYTVCTGAPWDQPAPAPVVEANAGRLF